MLAKKRQQVEHPAFGMALKRRLPRASVEKANHVFENFSLSKFGHGLLPTNYVPSNKEDVPPDVAPRHAEQIKHVRVFQNNKIVEHLQKLGARAEKARKEPGKKPPITGATVALPKHKIATILPSFDQEIGTVVLSELMDLVEKHTRGTEFYANGDPTLNRLALLKRIDKMKQSLGMHKDGEAKKDGK